ncbi:MAG: DegT/DnrJ/EryC1/StrS family aminotransferase [Thermoproteota archaeon]
MVKPWPEIREEDKKAVLGVLDRGILWGGNGPEVKALEEEWCRYVGSKHCLVTNSGTAALHMAVAAAGVKPGDEVIAASLSWTSSATCILHHNAIPVFVDVRSDTLCINEDEIEEKVSDRTKAIIPVHYAGLPCDMDKVMDVAERHDLKVIEDCCQAHGATYKGKMVGTIGDIGCFSLNGSKNLSGGEGGLLVTDDDDSYREAARVWQFGENRREDGSREYNAYGMGWMYRTTEMTAAFARSQLRRLDWITERIRENCHYLSDNLRGIKGLRVPVEPPERKHVFWVYKVLFYPEELGLKVPPKLFRDKVEAALRAEGVETGRAEFIIPDMTLFHQKEGYGRGCPWSCHLYGKKIEYRAEDYPGAMEALARNTGIAGTKPPNGRELMERYVEAFQKIFDNVDEVVSAQSMTSMG